MHCIADLLVLQLLLLNTSNGTSNFLAAECRLDLIGIWSKNRLAIMPSGSTCLGSLAVLRSLNRVDHRCL